MKRNKQKFVFKVTALSLAIVVLLCVAASGILFSLRAKDLERAAIDVSEQILPDSGVTDGEGNRLVSGVSYEMPRTIVYSDTTVESRDASDGILVRATVHPEEVSNKNVEFKVAFAHAISEWAVGKNVGDYITVTPTGTRGEAIVKCLEPFGEQIVLTAICEGKRTETVSCNIEYKQKLEWINLSFGDYAVAFEHYNTVGLYLYPTTQGGMPKYTLTYSDAYTIECDKNWSFRTILKADNVHKDGRSTDYVCLNTYNPSAVSSYYYISYDENLLQSDGETYVKDISNQSFYPGKMFDVFKMTYSYFYWSNGQLFTGDKTVSQMNVSDQTAMVNNLSTKSYNICTLVLTATNRDGESRTSQTDFYFYELFRRG